MRALTTYKINYREDIAVARGLMRTAAFIMHSNAERLPGRVADDERLDVLLRAGGRSSASAPPAAAGAAHAVLAHPRRSRRGRARDIRRRGGDVASHDRGSRHVACGAWLDRDYGDSGVRRV
jgi:hypothetical protein